MCSKASLCSDGTLGLVKKAHGCECYVLCEKGSFLLYVGNALCGIVLHVHVFPVILATYFYCYKSTKLVCNFPMHSFLLLGMVMNFTHFSFD